MRAFFLVWGGQLVSILGSGMTRFGLAFWVYGESGSVTSLSIVILAATVPALIVGPFAGTIVDRVDRRLVMIASDSTAGAMTLALAILWLSGHLSFWHIVVVAAVGAVAEAFQSPAYMASVTLLVPKAQLNRANGLVNVNEALSQVLAPVLAGVFVASIGLGGVLAIDGITFLVAITTLVIVRIPRPEKDESGESATPSLLGETAEGLRYLRARFGMLLFLFLAAILNFLLAFNSVLIFPLLLSFTNEAVMGSVLSAIGVAMLVGSLVASAWKGPGQRMRFMLATMSVGGACVVLVGLRPSALWIAMWAAGMMLLVPLINATSQSLWQIKIAPSYQGRVFATRRVIATFASPLALILAGPLADRVFEPLMAAEGGLADTAGRLIGTGPGRGVALMYVLMGLGVVATSLGGFLVRPLRNVETEIPDAIADSPEPVGA